MWLVFTLSCWACVSLYTGVRPLTTEDQGLWLWNASYPCLVKTGKLPSRYLVGSRRDVSSHHTLSPPASYIDGEDTTMGSLEHMPTSCMSHSSYPDMLTLREWITNNSFELEKWGRRRKMEFRRWRHACCHAFCATLPLSCSLSHTCPLSLSLSLQFSLSFSAIVSVTLSFLLQCDCESDSFFYD